MTDGVYDIINTETRQKIGEVYRVPDVTGHGENLRYKRKPRWLAFNLRGSNLGGFNTRKAAVTALLDASK